MYIVSFICLPWVFTCSRDYCAKSVCAITCILVKSFSLTQQFKNLSFKGFFVKKKGYINILIFDHNVNNMLNIPESFHWSDFLRYIIRYDIIKFILWNILPKYEFVLLHAIWLLNRETMCSENKHVEV